MDELIGRAREYAVGAHARINQLRKYTRQPYDVHLKAVADLVAAAGGDPAMVAAAWLHDTVEDTPATFEEIEREFGADVAALVKELTDVSRPGDGNRAARKAIDREHLASASRRAKTIKLADIADNCEDICRHDAKFGRVYLGEAKELLGVLAEGDRGLLEMAAGMVSACEARLGPASGAAPLADAPLRGREIDPRQRVALDAPLAEVIHVLTQFSCCFVELDGTVVGAIDRGDVGKPVVRMWLFGSIILIEVQVVERVRARWPGGEWGSLVSAGRMEKARLLQAERRRRGLPADLLDCLQFSDKLQIVLRDGELVGLLGFASANAAKKSIKDLESLRNNLAHGQDVTGHDWPQIVRLARRVQQLYGT